MTEQEILDFANKVVQYTHHSEEELDDLLNDYNNLCCSVLCADTPESVKEFTFSIIYRLIYFTNDLANAEAIATNTSPNYELTYKMIHELKCLKCSDVFYEPLLEQLVKKAFKDITLVNLKTRPLDCWKYLPEFLHYIHNDEDDSQDIDYIIDIIVTRLLVDSVKIKLGMEPSTLAFWLPKEKSKQLGYLTHPISYHLFNSWIKTAEQIEHPSSLDRAKTKCLTHYRKMITELKTHLDIDKLREIRYNSLLTPTPAPAPVKYTSYAYLLSDLCKENFITVYEDMSKLWESSLYGDMPGLVSIKKEEEEEEEEVEEVEEKPKGWFSWLW